MARSRSPMMQESLWRLEAFGYDLFTLIVRALPVEWASALGARLGRLIGPCTRAHRTAISNLRLAFPDMDAASRAAILKAQWENCGRYLTEFPILDRLTPASGRVEVVGADRLEAIKARGRPTVLISGHLSNMEVMVVVILAAGTPCEVTYRALNNPRVDERIKASRFRYGVRMFAPKGARGGRDLLAALRAGRSVAMMNDQRYDSGPEGLFFGHPVNSLPAAVRLAQRFGTDITPMSIQRLTGARFRCEVHPPILPPDTGDRAADIASGVQTINQFIEGQVRARPGEWWWMHRRWPARVYAAQAARDGPASQGQ